MAGELERRQQVARDEIEVLAVLGDVAADERAERQDGRAFRARLNSAVWTSCEPRPRPSKRGSISVCMNAITPGRRWYVVKPAVSPSMRTQSARGRHVDDLDVHSHSSTTGSGGGSRAAELDGETGMGGTPAELVSCPGRDDDLIEQEDVGEVLAQSCPRLVDGTGDGTCGAGGHDGGLCELGDRQASASSATT